MLCSYIRSIDNDIGKSVLSKKKTVAELLAKVTALRPYDHATQPPIGKVSGYLTNLGLSVK